MSIMLYIKKVSVIITFLGIVACNNTSKFPMEKEFICYLDEVFNLETEKSLYIFFLQSKSCGSCTNSALNVINDFYNQNSYPYIVLTGEDPRISKWLAVHPNLLTKAFIDTTWQFEKYGLRFSDHCFFHLDNKKIRFSAWITENNMDKLYEYLVKENI